MFLPNPLEDHSRAQFFASSVPFSLSLSIALIFTFLLSASFPFSIPPRGPTEIPLFLSLSIPHTHIRRETCTCKIGARSSWPSLYLYIRWSGAQRQTASLQVKFYPFALSCPPARRAMLRIERER